MSNIQLSKIKLVIGLGNPGERYEHTYHNVGKLFTHYFLKCLFLPDSGRGAKFRKSTASKSFEYLKAGNIIFVRPILFMNEGGVSVQAALKFFTVKPDGLLVIHDDSDIELGEYKISFGRGAGGHRGIESIIKKLKTKDFWRIRIGIRQAAGDKREETRRAKAGDFVLKTISRADEKILTSVFRSIEREIFITLKP